MEIYNPDDIKDDTTGKTGWSLYTLKQQCMFEYLAEKMFPTTGDVRPDQTILLKQNYTN